MLPGRQYPSRHDLGNLAIQPVVPEEAFLVPSCTCLLGNEFNCVQRLLPSQRAQNGSLPKPSWASLLRRKAQRCHSHVIVPKVELTSAPSFAIMPVVPSVTACQEQINSIALSNISTTPHASIVDVTFHSRCLITGMAVCSSVRIVIYLPKRRKKRSDYRRTTWWKGNTSDKAVRTGKNCSAETW